MSSAELKSQLTAIVQKIFKEAQNIDGGAVATYIPELAKVDPGLFSVALTDIHGNHIQFGDTSAEFTLQSTSKPFVYARALEVLGESKVLAHVGVEPTGEAFDSIIELERHTHRPYNPMINSGAIAIANLLGSHFQDQSEEQLRRFLSLVAGRELKLNESVFLSEKATANRNRAIAYLLKNFNVISYDIEQGLDLYFQQCSYSVNVKDLSIMAATLANSGANPVTKERVVSNISAQRTLSLMMTCGMYDTAGSWAYTVGVPAKSGVSGALFAVVPGQFGIAAFSPKIDSHGHSLKAYAFIEKLIQACEFSVFAGRSRNEI